jgi:hypothetical protein
MYTHTQPNSLFFQGDVPSFQKQSASMCYFCQTGIEYFDAVEQNCRVCTPLSSLVCQGKDETASICSKDADSFCKRPNAAIDFDAMCGNSVHNFGEQCDYTDKTTEIHRCCSQDSCKLMPGYYTDPPCSTICGDNIKTAAEECDNFDDPNCDTLTCKLF